MHASCRCFKDRGSEADAGNQRAADALHLRSHSWFPSDHLPNLPRRPAGHFAGQRSGTRWPRSNPPASEVEGSCQGAGPFIASAGRAKANGRREQGTNYAAPPFAMPPVVGGKEAGGIRIAMSASSASMVNQILISGSVCDETITPGLPHSRSARANLSACNRHAWRARFEGGAASGVSIPYP